MASFNGQHIIARFDRLPVWPFSRRVLFVIGVGFFFSFFDIITIALALPVIKAQFGVTLSQLSWAVTSGLIGYILGSILDSRISDRYGRRLALTISVSFYSIGSLLSATSPSLGWLILWRVISGMGIGAEISEVTTYMSEMSPASIRGRLSAWAIAMGFWGFAIAPFVGLLLVPVYPWGWRALFLLGGIGGTIIYFMRRSIPLSPRWLVLHNRLNEANEIVKEAESRALNKINKPLPAIAYDSLKLIEAPTHLALKKIFHQPYINRMILFSVIWCIYYIGNYAWLTLNVELFVSYGFKLKNSILFVAINSLGFIVGSILAINVSDKYERKYVIFLSALIWVICLMLVGWIPTYTNIIIFGFVAAITISLLIPLLYTYTAENFPTRIRATSVALTDGVGHIGGAFCAQIVFAFYNLFSSSGYGYKASFTVMAVTGLASAILVLFGIRMTGKSLSSVSKTAKLVEH